MNKNKMEYMKVKFEVEAKIGVGKRELDEIYGGDVEWIVGEVVTEALQDYGVDTTDFKLKQYEEDKDV